ncbi:hypothetical protein, partial [[Eubacterium] cellulosolvens]
VIQITGDSTLKLIEGSITNADAFKAAGNSNIELQNGTIETKNFDINCNELKIISSSSFHDIEVARCELLSIQDSTVTSIEVDYCGHFDTLGTCKILNSNINSLSTGSLLGAEIGNLRFNTVDELELTGCQVNILKINNMVKHFTIHNSDISQLDIENCQVLETYNTDFDNSKLKNSQDLVEFHSSEVKHCSIFPEEIRIYDSVIIGNEDELNDLTRGRIFIAYNSSFNSPLHFTGTTEAHLNNCSTLGNIPPKVIADQDANIHIYWWLDVQVLANGSKPLPGAIVSVCDFFNYGVVASGISDANGRVSFSLLANTITKTGWETIDNKSYYVKGSYQGLTAENGTGLWMEKNSKSELDFTEVKEKKSKPKEYFTRDTIIGIVIFFIIIILIIMSVVGGKESKSRSRDRERTPPKTKTGKRNGPRRDIGNGGGNGYSNGAYDDNLGPNKPGRSSPGLDRLLNNGDGRGSRRRNNRNRGTVEVKKVTMNRRLKTSSRPRTPR